MNVELEDAATGTLPAETTATPLPAPARILFPSVSDLLFCVFAVYLTAVGRYEILNDAGVGWHLHNGENILRTWSFTRVDPFSYTMPGKPWFAWEWLFDIGIALLYRFGGLLALSLVTALVFAGCFSALYHLLRARSGNPVVSAALVILAALASYIHILARPHVVSWLFVVVVLAVLRRALGSDLRYLWILPALTVVWTNFHGSFFLGIILIVLFGVGLLLEDGRAVLPQVRALVLTALGCGVATLVNPYGYRLHQHVAQYLSNRFFMDHIAEFSSASFHDPTARWFVVLIALVFVAFAYRRRPVPATDLLLALFAISSGLYAARSIPVAAILLAYVSAPLLAGAIENRTGPRLIERISRTLVEISANVTATERQVRGHLVAIVIAVVLLGLALSGGRIGSRKVLSADFPPDFPAAAADRIKAATIHEGVFTNDQWGSYLIYRLYPGFRVFVDDRHDFYGLDHISKMLTVAQVNPGWDKILQSNHVNYVLVSPESAMASILRIAPGWSVMYEDKVAVLFERTHTLPSN